MKRCPTCNEIYSDQLQYCLADGHALAEAPSADDEIDTLVRSRPFVVDVEQEDPAEAEAHTQPVLLTVPQMIGPDRGSKRTYVFLAAGILIGGSLVLAAVLAVGLLTRGKFVPPIINPTNTNEVTNPEANIPAGDNRPESDREARENLLKRGFNGRVIMMNAIVRSFPSASAPEVIVLPFNAPLKIGKSAGGNNPWFRVTTEGGERGWMHGNTIEFIK